MATLTRPKPVTKEYFYECNECFCGKEPFKYHDVSKNIYIRKCKNIPKELDLKTKEWVDSKKQPCGFNIAYHAERPVFKEIQKVINNTFNIKSSLESRLKSLFRFLEVSSHSSTLQEIDIIVQYTLNRPPRKIFYFPTTTLFMKESHRESYKDYQDRIFSEKIVDRSHELLPKVVKPVVKKPNKRVVVKKSVKPVVKKDPGSISQFIEVTDSEHSDSDSDSDSEKDRESDSGESENSFPDLESEESDLESTGEEEPLDELDNFEEEPIDDTYEDVDSYDYD
jgi:hypothetical protein